MPNKNPNTKGLISGARGIPPLESGEISTTVRIRGKKRKLEPFIAMTAAERGDFVTNALEKGDGEESGKKAT